MVVTSDLPLRVFSDPSCWPVLRRIVVQCIDDHKSLALLCRNVRFLLLTDPDVRDKYFHTVYGLPLPPRSLDHTSQAAVCKTQRSPPDREAYLREQALQQFAPSVIRCVHTDGAAAAVRDGYMVTYKVSPGDGSPTTAGNKLMGWTVWYLPQWHDVRKAYDTNRDTSKTHRGDPLMVKDMPLLPRPAGAIKNQNMWTWDFDLDSLVIDIAIHPEDNLLAVVTMPRTIRYSVTDEKVPSLTGRRHRVHFFQLRPTGLACRGDKPHTFTPVRHPEAARPHVDLLEPIVSNANGPSVQMYNLKIGANGKVGLLLLSKDGQERSGPVIMWDWRRGECVGLFNPREGKVNFLDFDWYTTKHIALMEACSPQPPPYAAPSNSTARPTPFKIRLTVLRLGGSFPINNKITIPINIKVTRVNPNGVATIPVPHTWLLTDLKPEKLSHLVALEMPPTLDRGLRLSPQQLPLATLYARISVYPAVSDDYFLGSLAFSIGCKRGTNGTPSNTVVCGTLPAALLASLISLNVKVKVVKTALAAWQAKADLPSEPALQELIRRKLEDAVTHQTSKPPDEDLGQQWDETFMDDFRFCYGSDLFQSLVKCADDMAGSSKRVNPQRMLTGILGGEAGLKMHGDEFARLLTPLACTLQEATTLPFGMWCGYGDIFITSSSRQLVAYGSRVVYLDQNNPSALAGKKLKDDLPAELTDRRCFLVMRNYSLAMAGFPKDYNMNAAQWYWRSTDNEAWRDKIYEPLPPARLARYVKCQGQTIHPPWLGTQVLGSAHWEDRELPVYTCVSGGPAKSSTPYTELRVPLVADKNGIKGVYFDGQTIVLAQVGACDGLELTKKADKVTLISF